MPITYKQAFALTDNPFGPSTPFPDMTRPNLLSDIQSLPLNIHREPKLKQLYCADAGPFRAHFDRFSRAIGRRHFSSNPASRGVTSDLVVIRGDQGTGKTSFASYCADHLLSCTPNGSTPWLIFDSEELAEANVWRELYETAALQADALNAVKTYVLSKSHQSDYCILILDNLLEGTEGEIVNLYDTLKGRRVVFVFLTTSVDSLFGKASKYTPDIFLTTALDSQEALAFTAQRINLYRNGDAQLTSHYPLFPFAEGDLCQAVTSRLAGVTGVVTLRVLGTALSRALKSKLDQLDATQPQFDIGSVSRNELGHYLISIPKEYSIFVNRS